MSMSGSYSMTMDFLMEIGFGFMHAFASEEKRDDKCMPTSAQSNDEKNGFGFLHAFASEEKTNCQSSLKMFVL